MAFPHRIMARRVNKRARGQMQGPLWRYVESARAGCRRCHRSRIVLDLLFRSGFRPSAGSVRSCSKSPPTVIGVPTPLRRIHLRRMALGYRAFLDPSSSRPRCLCCRRAPHRDVPMPCTYETLRCRLYPPLCFSCRRVRIYSGPTRLIARCLC
ncbi:hypothetical protein OH76DRAFT_1246826 [Lentinus brumalis]|uniref:Uncharacterized protein n=1 Tax=Lentinus brumalis TaxID=2498619 RepID=A0A371CRU3_9APHY|nr:hypothetical protein OH76DRAFT_1246826 [Polyporus brumalis]